MDDNPWGATDESPSPRSSPPTKPNRSVRDDSVQDDEPVWNASDKADEVEEERAAKISLDESTESPPHEETASTADRIASINISDDSEAQSEHVQEADADKHEPALDSPPMSVPTLSMDLSLTDQGPPMDDFPDYDDHGFEQTEQTLSAPFAETNDDNDGFDDDEFDDFGEAGQGEDDDDFGEFGDFDSATAKADNAMASDDFLAASQVVQPVPQPPPAASLQSTWSSYAPLQLDLTDVSRTNLSQQLSGFFEGVFPAASLGVSDEPERQVEGVAQILVNEQLRGLLSNLSSMPALRPLDWRRSRVRREHLIAMGVPVNLDESFDAKPLASLVLPPVNTSPTSLHRSASPAATSHGIRSSSPASATVVSPPFHPPSRTSTPFADRERARQASQAPPLDRHRAEALCAIAPDELLSFDLARLRSVSDQLDEISRDASSLLTHALMAREKENADAETYNEMIQDLVTAAAKVKTTTGRSATPPIRSASGRFGRK
ncbi:hypothetical protein OIO90_004781 [Microbotryomycetes sp. JL221]|nr:hypothetical protein OIO90_004781 [Microbotryomycetes sp. JL221]